MDKLLNLADVCDQVVYKEHLTSFHDNRGNSTLYSVVEREAASQPNASLYTCCYGPTAKQRHKKPTSLDTTEYELYFKVDEEPLYFILQFNMHTSKNYLPVSAPTQFCILTHLSYSVRQPR